MGQAGTRLVACLDPDLEIPLLLQNGPVWGDRPISGELRARAEASLVREVRWNLKRLARADDE
jgi:hypothetical protein